jgi:hypothetical protein
VKQTAVNADRMSHSSYGVSASAALDVLLRLGVPVVRCDDPPSDAFFTERDGVATVRACVREAHGCVSLSALSRALRVANVPSAFLRKHALASASALVLVQLAAAADDDALGVCGDSVCTASFVRALVAACRRDVGQSATAMLLLDDLVRRVALPAADLAALLRQCCCDDGATFDADARALLAPGFAKRSDAAVRSALLSFDEPVAIDVVVDAARLPRDFVVRAAERLVRSGAVPGVLENGLFTPNSQLRQRDEYVAQFLASNGFVECAAVDAYRPGSARTALGARSDGVLLDTVFVTHDVVRQVDAALSHVLEEGHADRSAVLPSFLADRPVDDLEKLLARCGPAGKQVVLLSSFLVSAALRARCDLWLRTTYRLMREALARTPRAKASPAAVDVDREALDALRLCTSCAAVPDALLEELWREKLRESMVELRAQRVKVPPDSEIAALQSRDRDAAKAAGTRVLALHFYVQHLQRSHAALPLADDERRVLDQHLLRTLCASILNLIVANRVLAGNVVAVELCSAADGGVVRDAAAMPGAVRDALMARLELPDRQLLLALASAPSVEAFMERLASASDALAVPVQELDRKKEKGLLKSQCLLLREQLATVVEPSTVLHQAALLLFATHMHALCHVPSERVDLLLRLLRDRAAPLALECLERHHALVQRAALDQQLSTELAECAEATRQLVLRADANPTT